MIPAQSNSTHHRTLTHALLNPTGENTTEETFIHPWSRLTGNVPNSLQMWYSYTVQQDEALAAHFFTLSNHLVRFGGQIFKNENTDYLKCSGPCMNEISSVVISE